MAVTTLRAIGRADLEAALMTIILQQETALRNLRQVISWMTNAGASATLEGWGYQPADAAAIIDAFSGAAGLEAVFNAYEGKAPIPTAIDVATKLRNLAGLTLI